MNEYMINFNNKCSRVVCQYHLKDHFIVIGCFIYMLQIMIGRVLEILRGLRLNLLKFNISKKILPEEKV
jgi:hypothetical protein